MTYIPTKSKLEELGFHEYHWDYSIDIYEDADFRYKKVTITARLTWQYHLYKSMSNEFCIEFVESVYPSSLEDLRTLIRLLTPQ